MKACLPVLFILLLFSRLNCFGQLVVPLSDPNAPGGLLSGFTLSSTHAYTVYNPNGHDSVKNYRLDKFDGNVWTPIDTFSLTSGTGHNRVYCMQYFNDTLYIGGDFFNFKGINGANQVVGYKDGTYFALANGISTDLTPWNFKRATNMAIYQSKLIVGGQFSLDSGIADHPLVQWDGFSWTNVGPALTNVLCNLGVTVSGLTVSNDKLYVRGNFEYAGADYANMITYYENGAYHAIGGSLPSSSVYGVLQESVVFDGTNIYTTQYEDSGYRYNVRKWDGSQWTTIFTVGDQHTLNTLLVSDGVLLIGGSANVTSADIKGACIYTASGISHVFNFQDYSQVNRFFRLNGGTYFLGYFRVTGDNHYYEYGKINGILSGVDAFNDSPFMQVYPNPFTGTVTLGLSHTAQAPVITVYNVLGETVNSQTCAFISDTYTIDLAHLPAGIYTLHVMVNGERVMKQIQKI